MENRTKEIRLLEPIKLERGQGIVSIPYLAFADDLAILTDNEETAVKQMKALKECAEKVDLRISLRKQNSSVPT